jgi:hypothetical protein
MSTELLALKAKLCGFELASRKLRRRISNVKGMKRWSLQFRKSALGSWTREHLIAYGVLRGLAYAKIEPKCDERNKPNIDRIVSIIHAHTSSWERKKWTRDHVAKLLEREAQ